MIGRGLRALVLALVAAALLPSTAAAGPCRIESSLDDINEGLNDERLGFPRASRIKVLVLYADFPGAAGDPAAPGELTPDVGGRVAGFFDEVSYGRAKVTVEDVGRWLRLPRPSSFYELEESVTHEEYERYLTDVIAVADREVDFSKYDIVQVFNPEGVGMTRAHAFLRDRGKGLRTGEGELRFAAGSDTGAGRESMALTLVHEMGHALGLPDLYDVGGSFDPNADVDLNRFNGLWDLMGRTAPIARFNSWHRLKLGWLRSSEVRCITRGSVVATLSPVDSPDGTRALVARVASDRAWVAEVRPPAPDEWGCGNGVLLYRVDANVETGSGPIRAATKVRDSESPFCTTLAKAPFGPGLSRAYVTNEGVRLDVGRRSGDSYVVRLSMRKQQPREDPPPPPGELTTVLP